MAYDPPEGETPLENLPEYGGAGGDITSARFYAGQKFKELFGRNPTAGELTMLAAAYVGSSRHVANNAQGDAAVAQYFYSRKNNPEDKKKKAETEAPQHYGQVGDIYQELLGKGATQDELDHFGKMLASGEVDPYELRNYIKQLPEYQEGQDKEFREGLNKELTTYDTDVFNREKENVISRFAQAGRLNSPSLDFALTDLMGKISSERSRYLAGVSANQYEGNKAAAREDYRTTLDRTLRDEDYNRARQYQLWDMYQNRVNEITDYNRTAQDYYDAMRRQKGNRGANAFSGALGGAAVGGSVGGPWGAAIGGVGGGLFGYFNS